MQRMTVDLVAIRLTETILGEEGPDLEQTLKALAANIGVLHIAYAPLCLQKSEDANLLSAICTYPVGVANALFQETIRSESIRSLLGERGGSALRLG